jgi:hypothetical protein
MTQHLTWNAFYTYIFCKVSKSSVKLCNIAGTIYCNWIIVSVACKALDVTTPWRT